MKKWTTTSWMYETFGQTTHQEVSKTTKLIDGWWRQTWHRPDYDALAKSLNKITDYCNKNQMAVKAVMPLTSAQTYEKEGLVEYGNLHVGFSGAGLSHGWGFSNVIGLAALLERVEDISDEEYERRCNDGVSLNASPSIMPPPLPAEVA